MKPTAMIFLLSIFIYSCKSEWTDERKTEFLEGCMKGAVRDMGPVNAKAYCNCMLQKVMQRYPNSNDARHLSRDTAMPRIGRECLKQP